MSIYNEMPNFSYKLKKINFKVCCFVWKTEFSCWLENLLSKITKIYLFDVLSKLKKPSLADRLVKKDYINL